MRGSIPTEIRLCRHCGKKLYWRRYGEKTIAICTRMVLRPGDPMAIACLESVQDAGSHFTDVHWRVIGAAVYSGTVDAALAAFVVLLMDINRDTVDYPFCWDEGRFRNVRWIQFSAALRVLTK